VISSPREKIIALVYVLIAKRVPEVKPGRTQITLLSRIGMKLDELDRIPVGFAVHDKLSDGVRPESEPLHEGVVGVVWLGH
jgi:hypothetical protein